MVPFAGTYHPNVSLDAVLRLDVLLGVAPGGTGRVEPAPPRPILAARGLLDLREPDHAPGSGSRDRPPVRSSGRSAAGPWCSVCVRFVNFQELSVR